MSDLRDLVMQVLGHARNVDERHKAWIQGMERERAKIAGIKPIRFPKLIGTGSTSLAMGGDNAPPSLAVPEGFVVAVRELVVEGMTGGGTPDVINIWRRGSVPAGTVNAKVPGEGFWQLNGNVFFQTWGYGEKLLWPGEALLYTAGSPFAATGQIIAHGIWELVPAEMIGKLFD